MAKLKWQVGAAPTGRYHSFHKRSWPSAYLGENMVAWLDHPLSYTPALGRSDDMGLREPYEGVCAYVADRSQPGPFKWRRMKERFDSVAEAKAWVEAFYERNPGWLPATPKPG
jgi:hypothetical protein